MTLQPITGVILAAGKGSRIRPLSDDSPKPLLPVCNRPIMRYHLDLLAAAGVRDVVVVIGLHGDAVRKAFGDGSDIGLTITYVVDEEPQGIASSLALAEPFVGDVCAVVLGDIFVSMDDFSPLLDPIMDGSVEGTLLVIKEADPEAIRRNFAVEVVNGGRIRSVVEKPLKPTSDLKGCGIYAFRRSIFDAIRRTPPSDLRNELELTDAIQTLVHDRQHLRAIAAARWDINVTSPLDLLDCNLRALDEIGNASLLGQDVRLPAGSSIVHSVVGDGVEAEAAVSLDHCLVLPNTRIAGSPRSYVRAILSQGGTLNPDRDAERESHDTKDGARRTKKISF